MHAPALAPWRKREVSPARRGRESLTSYIRETCETYHHQAGTCKMGVDAESVVDPELRVYGLEGLRVADASIMPNVISGNTNAPSIMIGEKAADLIRGTRVEVQSETKSTMFATTF
jgi:choline dehydrogenase